MRPLTFRARLFVAYFLETGNATDAARRAGFAAPNTAGPRLLLDVRVRAAIAAHLDGAALSADEALARLSDVATADASVIADCLVEQPDGRRVLDWRKVRARGIGHLIRSVRPTKHGDVITLHDSLKALELIGRFRSLWNDPIRLDHGPSLSEMSDDALRALASGGKVRP